MSNITVIPALRAGHLVAGKASIVIRVIIGRKVAKTINTGIKVPPDQWDPVQRQVNSRNANHKINNQVIKREVARIETQLTSKALLGASMTKAQVKKIAEGKDPGSDFYKFCEKWIPEKHSNKETLRTYNSEVTKLRRFSKSLSFGDIDYKFLTGYKRYMGNKLKNLPNTVWKSFKFLNTMIRDAMKMKGIIDSNPFDEFDRGSYTDPTKLGIEIQHCDLIEPICTNETLPVIVRRVAIKFLLMCYSGLRFEDAMRFDPAVHVIDGDRIVMVTQKKSINLNMKLYNRLSNIIELLKANPLPAMSNKDFNKWLRVVANLAGIGHMKITCHVGRHTFGGLLAEMEIPEEQAQRLLAHKDIRSTRVYYHVKAKNLDKAMDKMNDL